MNCHLCIYWTPETGCDHYRPSAETTQVEQLASDIIANEHNQNYRIVETNDFKEGVKSAVKYLKKHQHVLVSG